jgi:4-hydroxybenzoyl-CoA thioesterase
MLEENRMAFRTTIQVRFGDVDHAGIVYYPRFYIYFHEAFEDLFNAAGHSYVNMLDVARVGFPTVHVETDFKAPLRYGDSLDIELSIAKLGERSATLLYKGYRHRDGLLCVLCEITVACIDMDAFKSRPIPPDIRALFARFQLPPASAPPPSEAAPEVSPAALTARPAALADPRS